MRRWRWVEKLAAFRLFILIVSFFGIGFALSAPSLAQLAEQNRGFPPNSTFATSGIDHVNLFSTNVAVSIPIGPNYPIGAGLSHQLRLTYNNQIWNPLFACARLADGYDISGVYVVGTPTVGVGWALELGHLVGAPPNFFYMSPEGSQHKLAGVGSEYRTTDSSFLRARNLGPQYWEVDFPDGTVGVFNRQVPAATVQHGSTSRDFNERPGDLDSGDPLVPNDPGLYLTQLRNRFGDFLQVNYEFSGGTWRVQSVQHFGQAQLLRTITFGYTQLTVNTVPFGGTTVDTWTALNSISFPTVQGQTQTVNFGYYTSGFPRTAADATQVQCMGQPLSISKREVAAPLLQSIELAPGYTYTFDYVRQFGSGLGVQSGAMKQLSVPTGGVIRYLFPEVTFAGPGPPFGYEACQPFDFACHTRFIRTNVNRLNDRQEFPEGLSGPVYSWHYMSYPIESLPAHQITEVTAPDGYRTKQFFHLEPNQLATLDANGIPIVTEDYNQSGLLVRRSRQCYEADAGGSNVCGPNIALRFLGGNLRESLTDVTTYNSGGGPVQTKRTQRTLWDSYGHWGREDSYDWDNVTLRRSTMTQWTPNAANWILNLYSRQTQTEGGSSRDSFLDFDSTNGFLRGRIGWDSPAGRILANCYYPTIPNTGVVQHEVSATALGFSSPPPNLCSPPYLDSLAAWPPNVIGFNNDAFGKQHVYHPTLRLLTSTNWLVDHSPAPWSSFNVTRDPITGLVTTSYDTAGLATGHSYDVLGRPIQISPPGGETPTTIAYGSTTETTVTRSGEVGLSTWQRYLYDGFGRLVREIRQMPAGSPSAYALRLRRYDSVGRESFISEWVGCPNPAGCATQAVTAGTTSSNFDPFGRPQMITKADGSTTSISYADGTVTFSDTQKTVTVNNVDGTCSGGSCSGGNPATTVYRYDVFGRLIQVTEPGGDQTTYAYDVNDKLVSVSQPPDQFRIFAYDSLGFLRSETTPEKGTMTYNDSGSLLAYGSLGNVLRETHVGSGLLRGYCYDFAGRVRLLRTNEDGPDPNCATDFTAAGRTYLQNSYDQSGFGSSAGKLTTRSANNPSVGSTVTDSFSYFELGGRLSSQVTSVSGGPNLSTIQRWRYNGLGLLAHHYHSRAGGASPFVVSMGYDVGLPVTQYLNGIPMVKQIAYQPSGALASYKTGINVGGDVTTTVQQDLSLLPRPRQISTSGASQIFDTGIYSYDGAGNVKAMGSDSFSYDPRSRLISATLSGVGSQGYTYDRYSNLLSKAATTYCSGTCPNNQIPGATYVRGNLLNHGGQSFTYDDLDRMTSNTASLTYNYVYGGDDERVGKLASGLWSYSLRDEARRVVSEFSGATPSRDNVFLGNQLVASYTIANPDGGPAWAFYASDHLGTPRLVTNLIGTAVETRRYWPYGEQATAATPFQRLRFATMELDLEAGSGTGTLMADRYYDHARSHVGGLGRFLSPDKLQGYPEDPQSWNRYSYSLNNPLKHVDPDGLAPTVFQSLSEKVHVVANVTSEIAQAYHGELGTEQALQQVAGSIELTARALNMFTATGEAIGSGADAFTLTKAISGDAKTFLEAFVAIAGTAKAFGADTTKVVHFTNEAGATAIEGSGNLRAGSYVTKPGEVKGLNVTQVESKLEIAPGKGAKSFTTRVKNDKLVIPENGKTTSGGAWQRQLSEPCKVSVPACTTSN